MIDIKIDDNSVKLWLAAMPGKVHDKLLAQTRKLAFLLQAHVVKDYLSGQALNFRTHQLQKSIQQSVDDSASGVIGQVYVNQSSSAYPYAKHWEFGGTIPAHDIVATKAKALAFLWNGKQVFFKKVHIPARTDAARPFLRPALRDMEPKIVQDLKAAVIEGMK